jgi:hypothetical protein
MIRALELDRCLLGGDYPAVTRHLDQRNFVVYIDSNKFIVK